MTKKQIKKLITLIIEIFIFLIIVIIDKIVDLSTILNNKYSFLLSFILYFSLYIIVGYKVFIEAFEGIIHKKLLDENFLMTFASLGAFALGLYSGFKGEIVEGFDEGVAVLLFYEVGEFFEDYAVNKSRNEITSLLSIRPETANLFINNNIKVVEPESLNIDDIIIVNPGEKIPVDGIVIEGSSLLDMKSLNGESLPLEINKDDKILSGSINISNKLKIKVIKKYEDSTIAKILDLVENATNNKSKSENFISVFAIFYTPIIVISAILLFLIPTIITSNFDIWFKRSLNFLVVSCPCALVISIPLAFFAGLGKASHKGILIKGSNYLEKFNKANVFVFDKTGTLTKGNFEISNIYPTNNKDNILKYAAIAESSSNHPIAKSIVSYYKDKIDNSYNIEEISGCGIKAYKDNEIILCGNDKLLDKYNIKYDKVSEVGTIVYVCLNNNYLGYIEVKDGIKDDSYNLINYLNKNHYRSIILSGDKKEVVKDVANKLNINEYKYSLLPQVKVEKLKTLLNDNDVVCYLGDGINDAACLAISDIGIAMGKVGQDLAIESSDIVFTNDNLNNIIETKKIAKKTISIVKQNIIFAILIKLLILVLSAFGITNMYMAVFGDVGVAFLAILNAMRVNTK